jgi:hypothetical protein
MTELHAIHVIHRTEPGQKWEIGRPPGRPDCSTPVINRTSVAEACQSRARELGRRIGFRQPAATLTVE